MGGRGVGGQPHDGSRLKRSLVGGLGGSPGATKEIDFRERESELGRQLLKAIETICFGLGEKGIGRWGTEN